MWPSPIKVMGACGLTASALTMMGGFWNVPGLVGLAGLVMIVSNVYALVHK